MKVRHGFVSNSSSSSFIIAIPKGMQINLENVLYSVFPETMKTGKDIDKKQFGYYGDNVSAIRAAQIIIDDLECQQPNDIEKIKEAVGGYIDSERISKTLLEKVGTTYPPIPIRVWQLPLEEAKVVWEEFDTKFTEWCDKVINAFMENNPGCNVYTLEYSDNGGSVNAAMEHAGVFNEMIIAGTAISASHH